MNQQNPERDLRSLAQEILGYLNFSSGAADAKFLKNLSDLFEILDRPAEKNLPTWRRLGSASSFSSSRSASCGDMPFCSRSSPRQPKEVLANDWVATAPTSAFAHGTTVPTAKRPPRWIISAKPPWRCAPRTRTNNPVPTRANVPGIIAAALQRHEESLELRLVRVVGHIA